MIAIVTDSSVYLSKSKAEALALRLVPYYYRLFS